MILNTPHARLYLADDEVARLSDARESRIEVTQGFVWVTIDGDRGDIVLGAGESFVVGASDVATLSAIRGAAAVNVHARSGARARPAAARHPHQPSRLRQLMAGISISPVSYA
ncbi:MAG TPA: DUF2917 domain-containing protein [Burkholderiaceae bacterium]